MRKWFLLITTAILSISTLSYANHTADPASVTIGGSLQSELGCSGDWQPDCAATHLGFDADDTVWQGTFTIPAGSFEYKAAIDDTWDENYGAGAVPNGPNIALNLPASTDVKFYYDHNTHWVTDNVNSYIATAVGSFQSELGCPGDWQPDCLRSWMQDPDGDGVYSFRTTAIPAGNYEMKVAMDESWVESYGPSNTPFTVPSDLAEMLFEFDYATKGISISASSDFGDAPDPTYPTLLASDGARHVVTGPLLGAARDSEADGQPTAGADGDDVDGTDDDDGVVFTSFLIPGTTASLDVTASAGCLLNAWIDFNLDGDWMDAGEQIFTDQALAAGVNNLTYSVPAGAVVGSTFARFRCSTAGGLSPTGTASDGEVEDYLVVITANQPPVSDPNGPYTGTVGTPVAFDGTGSFDPDGTIVAYDWDFGDGNVGTGVSPTHTYSAAGTYTVTLTVTDNGGLTDTATTTATISANQPPVSDPNGPYTGTVGTPVAFDGTGSFDPDGTIVAYDWDFGDGNVGTGVSPTHTYSAAGTYTVTLTVTDNGGLTDTATTTTTISANQPPVSDPNGPYTGTVGAPVAYDGTGSTDPGGTIVAYDWDFGDGNTGTGVSPTHTYAAPGLYTVTLTVTDNGGLTDTTMTTADISAVAPIPAINTIGLIVFMLLAGIGSILYIRRKRVES